MLIFVFILKKAMTSTKVKLSITDPRFEKICFKVDIWESNSVIFIFCLPSQRKYFLKESASPCISKFFHENDNLCLKDSAV